MKFEEKYGEESWVKCGLYRKLAIIPASTQILSLILWFFYPIKPEMWNIFNSPLWAILIALIIVLVFAPIMIKGTKDAGKETMVPSKETQMYGGIYRYIRHPQTLGEWPIFLAMGVITNSWLMVIESVLFFVITLPIMIRIEERDLIKRFGEPYRDYQKETGALLPRLRKK